MAFLLATKICNSAFFASLLVSTAVVSVSSYTFQVGGEGGWTKPTGNETETYNGWAEKNRFHVGDSVCKSRSIVSLCGFKKVQFFYFKVLSPLFSCLFSATKWSLSVVILQMNLLALFSCL